MCFLTGVIPKGLILRKFCVRTPVCLEQTNEDYVHTFLIHLLRENFLYTRQNFVLRLFEIVLQTQTVTVVRFYSPTVVHFGCTCLSIFGARHQPTLADSAISGASSGMSVKHACRRSFVSLTSRLPSQKKCWSQLIIRHSIDGKSKNTTTTTNKANRL